MKIRIPVPEWLTRRYRPIDNWLNEIALHLDVRYIDILLALGFIGCVSYHWITTGWEAALAVGLLYIMMAMMAIWLL